MPRPKTVSDEAVLAAAGRVFARIGPTRFTLTDVAEEAGLSAATLVQRFGSKRAMLVAFAEHAAAAARRPFERARAAEPEPLRALRAALLLASRGARDRQEVVNSLAFLLEDLSDDALRAAAVRHAEWTEESIRALLAEAVARGTVRSTDTRRLARALQAAWNGAIIQWALRGRGSLEAWLGAIVDTVLEPWIVNRS